MNIARLAVALVVALSGFNAWAQALEFKGVPFGASVAQFSAAHPRFRCYKTVSCSQYGAYSEGATYERLTYAGEVVTMIEASFDDDKLDAVRVSFHPGSYTRIAAALESKYGPPTTVTASEIKTRGGLTAANELRSWAAGSDIVSIMRYAGSLDTGSLKMQTPRHEARTQAERDEQAKKAKKDI
jgi:hypothetical protein